MSAAATTAVGPWTRLRVGLLVSLSLALFACAAGLATWLAERPGLRKRVDLTDTRRNTLDPAMAELIDKLPARATIEVFFRPLPKPIDVPGYEAQARMRDFLRVVQNARPEKVKIVEHAPEDIAGAAAALSRLRVDGDEYGLVVVHRDENRAPLRLFKDLAQVDVGHPERGVPPSLVAFRGEEAIAAALKRVSLEGRLKIYFTTGHGERNLYGASASEGNESRDLGALQTALTADGFETERFEGQGDPIPTDCAVLAVIDPGQALAEGELAAIRGYVSQGGRLLLGASQRYAEGPGSMAELAAGYGVGIGLGYVAEPVAGPNGPMVGGSDCANLFIGPDELSIQHPVTESMARYGRTLWSPISRPLSRKDTSAGILVSELARTRDIAWIDLPNAAGQFDWKPDEQNETTHARIPVAFAVELTAPGATGPALPEQRGRVVVLGSGDVLSSRCMVANKDFALNAFNWLAAREYRVGVSTRSEERRILDVRTGEKLFHLRSLALFLLPGLCALLGLVTWYVRRR